MPHGYNYMIGKGNRSSTQPSRHRQAKFRTTTPDGRRVRITMKVRGHFEQPMVVFTDETGKWAARTVVDKNNLPEWVANYTLADAEEIAVT